jgi:CRP-like cAMP-binding protein
MTSMATTSGAGRSPSANPTDRRGDERNSLLSQLSGSAYERLEPHLETVELARNQTLWEPDVTIRSIYFPRGCVLSVLVMLEDEGPVEAATIGREGLLGVPVALGADSTSSKTIAQVSGPAVRLPAALFRTALDEDAELRGIVLRYAQALLEQTSQSVACNRRHSMDERCARWLLMTHDRVGADRFQLTQAFLAFMLGVRRASVTVAAGMLQQAGLIKYSRGNVTILDRPRLEEASCECYGAVRAKTESLLKTSRVEHQ